MEKGPNKDFETPKVGIGVMVIKEGKVLMSKRKGSHGEGEYQFPGGHLEPGESFEQCAIREVKEETGLEISNVKFQFVGNITYYKPKHYVHIALIANWKAGEPKNIEPDKSSDWIWVDPSSPPKPLFEMCRLSFISYNNGQNYFDS